MRHHLSLLINTFVSTFVSTFVLGILGSAVCAEENKVAKPVKYEYPPEVIKTYMKGCGFTNSPEFCTCSLDKLRSQYNFDEFLKIDTAARETKKVPQEVIYIFQSCRLKNS